MIIYPMRKQNQIIFLEAKNTKKKKNRAKKELAEKLNDIRIPFNEDAIKTENKDAWVEWTL